MFSRRKNLFRWDPPHLKLTDVRLIAATNRNLRAEVEYYLKLERRARNKFGKQLAALGSKHEYRLSYSTGGGGKVAEKTLDLRLALSGNLGTPDTEELKGKEVIRKKTGLIK